jgi:hypothetical protein
MRVREFARPFIARSVETAENLKVSVGIEITFVTTNGFEQWFGVDRFEIVPARLQEFVKTQSIEKILTAQEGTARAIEEYLLGSPDGTAKGVLEDALSGYGLQAKRGHVFELDPELTAEEEQALTAEWRAKKRKAARKLDAEADAHYLTETSAPLKDNDALARIEITRAAAAGKGVTTVIVDSGAGRGTELATLAELQRIRGTKGGEST